MLKAGDKVPKFELDSDTGKALGPQSFPGKHVVVYFYPKDDTPGCTREAQAFTAHAKAFAKAGAVVLGVSKDSIAAHCKFRDKYKLAVPLLSDPDLKIHKAFGAYGEKVLYGKKTLGVIRSTFVVDPKGVVAKAYGSVKVDGHAEAVLAFVSGGDKAPAPAPAAKKAPAKAATKVAAKPANKAAAKKSAAARAKK